MTPSILCIIPARSGSKGCPHKNIKILNGKPMMAWSIEQTLSSKHKMRVVVSTDSEEYAKIARQYGAEVPFLRPSSLSQDKSICIEFVQHALEQLGHYDIVFHCRPTSPFRTVEQIDEAIDLFLLNRDNYDSLRSVTSVDKTPYKMYRILSNNLTPLFDEVDGIEQPYNQARQVLPKCYLHNGYIDLFNSDIVQSGTISGNRILPFIMNPTDNIDIDSFSDFQTHC